MAFAAVAAVTVALVAVAAGPHRIGDYFTETDFYGAYADGARMIAHGHVDPSRYGVVGPGYEFALALAGLAIPRLFDAAQAISIASVVATLLLWRALAARRLGPAAGALTVLLLGANATLFRYGYSATTDALALALVSAAAFALFAGRTPRVALGAGALAAAAFLTRYNALVLLPAGLIAIGIGGTSLPTRGRAALAFAGGFALLVLPWLAFALARGVRFHSQLYHDLAYEVYAHARGIAWDEYQARLEPQFHSLGDVLARDPGAVVARIAFNTWDHLRQDALGLLGLPVALAALAGLALMVRDRVLKPNAGLLLAGALCYLSVVPVFYSERYSLMVLPFYALLAAWAFASPWLRRGWGARPLARALQPALAALVLALSVAGSARVQAREMDQLPVEALAASRALQALARPGDAVSARKPHVAFHAGVRAVGFPFARTIPELAAYARAQRARWLYLSWPEVETRPAFYALLDTSAVVPGLVPRVVTRPHPAVLYEIGPAFGAEPAWMANDTLRTLHVARGRLLVNPHDLDALAALGDLGRATGRLDEARAALDTLLALAPRTPLAWVARGQLALALHDPAGAAAAFERAEALDPTSAEARIGRGWAALAAGRDADAAALWQPVAG
ncbi:MAG TPA: tetratricopeptide repeat protein, partial [Candidatus Eisenbacteria bacterium]|nr:tetratricopeptide repeat protein [Candidatus Eisenbacteria bacterium]